MKKFKDNYDVTNRTTTTKTQTPFSAFRKLHRWETGLLQEIYHNLWIDVSIFSINLFHDLTDSLSNTDLGGQKNKEKMMTN